MIITMVIIDLDDDDNRQCLKTLSETSGQRRDVRTEGRKVGGAGQLLRDSAAAAPHHQSRSAFVQQNTLSNQHQNTLSTQHQCVFTVLSQPRAVQACS